MEGEQGTRRSVFLKLHLNLNSPQNNMLSHDRVLVSWMHQEIYNKVNYLNLGSSRNTDFTQIFNY